MLPTWGQASCVAAVGSRSIRCEGVICLPEFSFCLYIISQHESASQNASLLVLLYNKVLLRRIALHRKNDGDMLNYLGAASGTSHAAKLHQIHIPERSYNFQHVLPCHYATLIALGRSNHLHVTAKASTNTRLRA